MVCGWSEEFLQCSALKCLGGWGKGRGQDLWCVVGQRGFCSALTCLGVGGRGGGKTCGVWLVRGVSAVH